MGCGGGRTSRNFMILMTGASTSISSSPQVPSLVVFDEWWMRRSARWLRWYIYTIINTRKSSRQPLPTMTAMATERCDPGGGGVRDSSTDVPLWKVTLCSRAEILSRAAAEAASYTGSMVSLVSRALGCR